MKAQVDMLEFGPIAKSLRMINMLTYRFKYRFTNKYIDRYIDRYTYKYRKIYIKK